MKQYTAEVYAQKSITVSAKNKNEARKKITKKFKKNPGKLEFDIEEGSGWY